MSVQALVAQLAGAGVQVRKDGDRLVLSGRTEHLDDAILAELRARKPALMEVVDVVETSSGGAPQSSFRIRPEQSISSWRAISCSSSKTTISSPRRCAPCCAGKAPP